MELPSTFENEHLEGFIRASSSYNLGRAVPAFPAGLGQTLYRSISSRFLAGGISFGTPQNVPLHERIDHELLSNPIVWNDSNSLSSAEELLLEAALGKFAIERLLELQKLPDGWGIGRGSALSLGAKESLVRLIESGIGLPHDPRIFLTNDGDITLVWPEEDGGEKILVCLPEKYQVYPESSDDELTFFPNQIGEIAEVLVPALEPV